MAYGSGMLKERVTVQNRTSAVAGKFGLDSSGPQWEDTVTLWAAVDWVRGLSAMRVGAIDAYSVIMVRMRWTSDINMRSRIVWQGQTYQILPDQFHPDRQANTIQFNAQLVIND